MLKVVVCENQFPQREMYFQNKYNVKEGIAFVFGIRKTVKQWFSFDILLFVATNMTSTFYKNVQMDSYVSV